MFPKDIDIEMLVENIHARQVVLGFSGWPDAGGTVLHTLAYMKENLPCEKAAVWDMDGFWHIGSIRPTVTVRQGHIRDLEWPAWRFFLCRPPSSQPVLIGMGPEPECHWRLFTRKLLQLLSHWGCREILLLGSVFDQVFHDEVTISCVVQDTLGFNRIHEIGCRKASYAGSAAIHSSIMKASLSLDIHALALWAHLPFYVHGPHEISSARLLEILGSLLGFQVDTLPLMDQWRERQEEIEESIHHDHDLSHMLESMKQQNRSFQSSGSTPKVVRLDEFLQKKHRPPPEPD